MKAYMAFTSISYKVWTLVLMLLAIVAEVLDIVFTNGVLVSVVGLTYVCGMIIVDGMAFGGYTSRSGSGAMDFLKGSDRQYGLVKNTFKAVIVLRTAFLFLLFFAASFVYKDKYLPGFDCELSDLYFVLVVFLIFYSSLSVTINRMIPVATFVMAAIYVEMMLLVALITGCFRFLGFIAQHSTIMAFVLVVLFAALGRLELYMVVKNRKDSYYDKETNF